jgi:hypothetical protein
VDGRASVGRPGQDRFDDLFPQDEQRRQRADAGGVGTMATGSFGLFAPRNGTVIAAFFVCALSVSAAIFLILELDRSFEGLLQVSSAPLRAALAQLGQ